MPLSEDDKKRIEDEERERAGEEERYREEVRKRVRDDESRSAMTRATEAAVKEPEKKSLSPEDANPSEENQAKEEELSYYFSVSPIKLIVMSLCTFGLYQFYWFYQNWKSIKHREKSGISPFWRAFFIYFFAYSLFKRVRNSSREMNIKSSLLAGPLAILFFTLSISHKLPDHYWLISFLSVFCLLPFQILADRINVTSNPEHKINRSFDIANWFGILIGGSFVLYCLYGTFELELKKQEVEKLPAQLDYTAGDRFSFRLPDNNWRFISKSEAKGYLGAEFAEAEVAFATSSLNDGGMLIAEKLIDLGTFATRKELNDAVAKLYREQVAGFTGVEVKPVTNGFDMEMSRYVAGEHFRYIKAFRAYQQLAITTLIWGKSAWAQLRNANIKIHSSFLELSGAAKVGQLGAKELFEKYSDAVTLIRVYSKEGKLLGYGSGFNIDPRGIVVTNSHVIFSGGHYVDVKFPNHGTFEDVKILGIADDDKDITILTLGAKALPTVDLPPSNHRVAVGEKVFAIGNPQGLVNTISEGIVSGIRGRDTVVPFYQITAPISPGSSGGPVVDEFGRVIGVASLYLEGAQNLNFAISVNELNRIETFDNQVTLKDIMEYQKAKKTAARK
jgi:S1-C subfamily serine protease